MKEFYPIEVAGLKRDLPVCPINEELSIGAFVIFGDVALTVACAKELNKIAPPHDIMITAESKGIPLIHEMARQQGVNEYVVARKGKKLYMVDPFGIEVHSITTANKQELFVGRKEMALMKDKRVLIVDDVISTGESLRAVEKLVRASGGEVAGKMAILAEGDAHFRDDILYLSYLPLLDGAGNPLR
ncbi:MAG: phosphoribosyltransferase family protein [Christensenellaceae bacterium]|jgi:adenine phosphoribosyltransferase